jgi:hypothetical protein
VELAADPAWVNHLVSIGLLGKDVGFRHGLENSFSGTVPLRSLPGPPPHPWLFRISALRHTSCHCWGLFIPVMLKTDQFTGLEFQRY